MRRYIEMYYTVGNNILYNIRWYMRLGKYILKIDETSSVDGNTNHDVMMEFFHRRTRLVPALNRR